MGDPRMLIYPIDGDGKLCGVAENSGKPLLFYFDFLKCISFSSTPVNVLKIKNLNEQICVKECPSTFWNAWTELYFVVINSLRIHFISIIPSFIKIILQQNYINKGLCAPYYMPTKPLVYRCLPPVLNIVDGIVRNNASEPLVDSNNVSIKGGDLSSGLIKLQGYGVKILSDVTTTWWLILLFVLLAMALSLVWIVLMRWIAGVIIWLSIVIFIAFFVAVIWYSFQTYVDLKNRNSTNTFILTTDMQYYANLKETWLAVGIIACILLFIVLLVLLFLIKRIRIAIALIKEASKAISNMMFTLLWPLIPFLMQIIVLVYWGGSAICLAAVTRTQKCTLDEVNKTEYDDLRCKMRSFLQNIECPAVHILFLIRVLTPQTIFLISNSRYTLALQAFQLFVWFWLLNFIIALSQVTLAGAFASYYWTFDKKNDLPMFPVTGAFYRSVRYHMGSMAFGSLLIAIVQIIVVILEYLDHKLKGRSHIVARFVLKCCICCFWCLEKFLKFLNKNAYIMIAIHGKNFCSSAFRAFRLIMANAIRVFVVDKLTDVLLLVNKLFIVGSVGLFAFFTFSRRIPGSEKLFPDSELNYYLIPILIVVCCAYIVASLFFGVYDMGVDTLFLCFLEDLERNDGSEAKPYFMCQSLMQILGKKNKEVAAVKKEDHTA
ncbi:hypothetical protein HELRODRAFT_93910 [Helobdella robusta]|uniref:Choline transporter-like protein n=1 Tax=Helobdella robusta TaxID=6412 RepID=T1G8Y1_HELRO|nr:hypothetical protein HELRODRAFT_93910 [Helobdella robusta]ESO06087.1 hypothetical protein HELRODRAFT_93910 [Helobdella robusta]